MTSDAAAMLPDQRAGPRLVGTRLSIMMFLQYAVPGVMIPVMARYLLAVPEEGGLGFTDMQVGLVMGIAGAVGALCAPLIVGQIADRYFSTERIMAVLLITAGVIKWVTAEQTTFWAWMGLSIAYALVYTPTMMLSNSLALAHMTDPDRQFPRIRFWGTLGWIVGGVVFAITWLQTDIGFAWKPPFLRGPEKPDALRLLVDSLKAAGVIAVAYGLYCLSLPHTSPKREASDPLAFLKAFRLMKRPSFVAMLAAGVIIAPIHHIYFLQTGRFLAVIGLRNADIAPAMSLGQFGELLVMAVLGLLIKRLGFRWVMTIGAGAYFLRYLLFALASSLPTEVIVASQALHGVCFGCFLAAGYIYVDHLADDDIRHSAQQVFFGFVISGVGYVLAAGLNGGLAWLCTPEGGKLAYGPFWLVLSGLGLIATLTMVILFRSEAKASNG